MPVEQPVMRARVMAVTVLRPGACTPAVGRLTSFRVVAVGRQYGRRNAVPGLRGAFTGSTTGLELGRAHARRRRRRGDRGILDRRFAPFRNGRRPLLPRGYPVHRRGVSTGGSP